MAKTSIKTESKEKKLKQRKSYVRYSGAAFQILAVIGTGTWIGYWIDNKLHLQVPIFVLLGSLLSLSAVIYYLIKQG